MAILPNREYSPQLLYLGTPPNSGGGIFKTWGVPRYSWSPPGPPNLRGAPQNLDNPNTLGASRKTRDPLKMLGSNPSRNFSICPILPRFR